MSSVEERASCVRFMERMAERVVTEERALAELRAKEMEKLKKFNADKIKQKKSRYGKIIKHGRKPIKFGSPESIAIKKQALKMLADGISPTEVAVELGFATKQSLYHHIPQEEWRPISLVQIPVSKKTMEGIRARVEAGKTCLNEEAIKLKMHRASLKYKYDRFLKGFPTW